MEGADKLLKLKIELGNETRQIVSGIAKHYRPEELVGKIIIVVANLKPAKIRGIESFGMLLAAKTGDTLKLATSTAAISPAESPWDEKHELPPVVLLQTAEMNTP